MTINEIIDGILKQMAFGQRYDFETLYLRCIGSIPVGKNYNSEMGYCESVMREEGLIDYYEGFGVATTKLTTLGQTILNGGGWIEYLKQLKPKKNRFDQFAKITAVIEAVVIILFTAWSVYTQNKQSNLEIELHQLQQQRDKSNLKYDSLARLQKTDSLSQPINK